MEQTMFLQWVARFLPGITIAVVNTLNGENQTPTYLHRSMCVKKFSVTGKWDSLSVANNNVAADIVAMDSELPLKARPSKSTANGEIPKMGMELWLNETQLTELDTMVAMDATDAQIVEVLFADTPRCITGIYERNEALFLQGLSTGAILVKDDVVNGNNTGLGVRLNFKFMPENQFETETAFGTTGYKPMTEIKKLKDKATDDGNVITVLMTDSPTIDAVAESDEAKQFYAQSIGFYGNLLPTPDTDQLNTMMRKKFGFVFQPVDRVIRTEKNGNETKYKPWKAGMIVGLTSTQNVGSLVWARLAEMNHPVENVTYEIVDDFIMISKYRKNKPLSEYTSSEARVVPVINNVDRIYTLDTTVTEG